jgi:glutamine synthetase
MGNPYLSFAAMMMAGLDGILNKIHPGDAMDKDLYDLPPEERRPSRRSATPWTRPSTNSIRTASS